MLLVLRFTADDAVAMAADYVCEESLTRSSVVSKFHDSLNDREANSETALDPRDRHQTMSIPHPSAFISKGPFLRQLLSLLHPAIDSLWNACRVAPKVQPATDRGRAVSHGSVVSVDVDATSIPRLAPRCGASDVRTPKEPGV
jgi:hypothetical protein